MHPPAHQPPQTAHSAFSLCVEEGVWCLQSCDFNCGRAGNPYGGVNCSGLAPKEYCADGKTFCFDNITTLGYAQTLPNIALGKAQGYTESYNGAQRLTSPVHEPALVCKAPHFERLVAHGAALSAAASPPPFPTSAF